MRTLTTKTETATQQTNTNPFHLIELSFSSVLRYSTRGSVTWNSETWSDVGADIISFDYLDGGAMAGQIALANNDNQASALVLNEGVHDVPCKIWYLDGDAPYAVDDAVMMFDGVCDGAPEIGDRLVIDILSASARDAATPRIFCAPPDMNHITPAGTVITWAGERYTLQAGNG